MKEMKRKRKRGAHAVRKGNRPAEELERAGKLEEAGEFWLRLCPCCKDIMIEEDGEDVFTLEHHDARRVVEEGQKGQESSQGDSLFKDLQTHNSSNPAVTYGD